MPTFGKYVDCDVGSMGISDCHWHRQADLTVSCQSSAIRTELYDYLLPHAAQVKVAHPLMLRAIALAKKKNDRIDASKIADCLRCDFLPECHMASERSGIGVARCAIDICWFGR